MEVYKIFEDCQESTSTHRRNVAALKKLFHTSVSNPEREREFTMAFRNCVKRILLCRRGLFCAEKCVKFIQTFLRNLSKPKKGRDATDDAVVRWLESLIRYLSRGFFAKEKSTRFRSLQLVSLCMEHISSLDDSLYSELLEKLLLAVNDKEMAVRAEACVALAKFQSDDPTAATDAASKALLEHLRYEAFPDVRKKALASLTPTALDAILERAQDADVGVRRAVFVKLSKEPQLLEMPLVFTAEKRDALFLAGLDDREKAVREACLTMTEQWIKYCDSNLLRFVSLLNVTQSPVALKLIRAIYKKYPNMTPKYDDAIWRKLTPELAFLGRELCESYAKTERAEAVESFLPEAAVLAGYIALYFERLGEATDDAQMDRLEFIIVQLLVMAKYVDYGDEVGRRETLSCLCSILQNYDAIPAEHISAIVPIVRAVSLDEQDFVFNIASVVADIRTEHAEAVKQIDEQLLSINCEATDALERQKASGQVKMLQKCLEIVKSLLEQIQGKWKDHPELSTLMSEIAIPVMVHPERFLRLTGAQCLGLCCTLDRSTALNNMRIFVQVAAKGDAELRCQSLKTISDMVVLYGIDQFKGVDAAEISKVFKRALVDDSADVETVAVEAVSKLLLLRILSDREMLRGLLMLYFHPRALENARMLQCLTYFFSVFSHSSSVNQALLASVAVSALVSIVEFKSAQEGTSAELSASITQTIQMLVDMTDYRRSAPNVQLDEAQTLHAQMAYDALEAAKTESARVSKWLLVFVSKLHLEFAHCTLEQLDGITDFIIHLAEANAAQLPSLQLRKIAAAVVLLEQEFIDHGAITEAEPNLLAIQQGRGISDVGNLANLDGDASAHEMKTD